MSQRRFDREARRRQEQDARRAGLKRRRALTAGAVGAAVLLGPSAAHAATPVVSSTADSGAGSLRQAIADSAGSDSTITFAPTMAGKTITLTTGQLVINGDHDLTITGLGTGASTGVTVTATGDDEEDESTSRIFSVSGSGDTRISGLILTGGNGESGGAVTRVSPVDGTGGGAITTDGQLTLTNVVVTGNVSSPDDVDYGAGGGILVTGGDTTVKDSTVSDNTAQGGTGSGGGIANTDGTLTVTHSFVTNNHAMGYTHPAPPPLGSVGGSSYGGGITAIGDTTVNGRSEVKDNTADFGAGIAGNDEAKYSFSSGRAVTPDTPHTLAVTDSTISGNEASTLGGGISVSFGDEYDDYYVAKFAQSVENVTVTRSTIDDNSAGDAGGGISVLSQAADNAVTVSASTVSNNSAGQLAPRSTRGGGSSGAGGGIELAAFGDSVDGPVSISNSTVSGNSASVGAGIDIGGEYDTENRAADSPAAKAARAKRDDRGILSTGSVVIGNTTVSDNDADRYGGGLAVGQSGVSGNDVEVNSTIIAGNTADGEANDTEAYQPPPVTDPGTTTTDTSALRASRATRVTPANTGIDATVSLIQTPGQGTLTKDAPTAALIGQNPQLGALGDNGGPTLTQLPAGTSPAIDAGKSNGLTTDQRGLARTVNRTPADVADGTDIGSVELPAEASTTQNNNQITPSAVPTTCGRRIISLVDARVKGGKVVLKGLVGTALYGKKVTIQTDPKGAKASGYSKTMTVTASKAGDFTAKVPKPSKEDYVSVRYRAVAGSAKSPSLKLPQSLTSKSVKSSKGTITVKGRVKQSVLGKRNKVKLRRLVCGRYRTVGSARPDSKGNYSITFKATPIRGVSLYRAEAVVQVQPGSKKYAIQYARAIAIKTTGQTG